MPFPTLVMLFCLPSPDALWPSIPSLPITLTPLPVSPCRTPLGLEDVSSYPRLVAELLRNPRWTTDDIKKLIGGNIIRVFSEVEKVSTLGTPTDGVFSEVEM